MKIGVVLNLEIDVPGQKATNKFNSRIIDMDNQFLFIDYPIDEKTGKTAIWSAGKGFSVTYLGKDNAVYQFPSRVVKKLKRNVPALAIYIPEKEHIKRIQRRQFVRIKASIDIAVHSVEDLFAPFQAITLDISGGGLAFIVPKRDILLESGDLLDIWIVLRMQSDQYYYLQIKGEIVNVKHLKNSMKSASVKFLHIDRDTQQRIIRYCFEKQREARRKELS